MMNLRYRNQHVPGNGGRTGVAGPGPSPLQRIGLVLGWVVLPYAWQRGVGALVRWGWHRQDPASSLQGRIAWLIPRLEAVVRGANLLNAIAFLRWGHYRSLLERVLATRLVYDRPVMARAVSFDYLNRQLVWAQVSELFLFLLPLLDSRRAAGVLRGWVKGRDKMVVVLGYGVYRCTNADVLIAPALAHVTLTHAYTHMNTPTTIGHHPRCIGTPASTGTHHRSSNKSLPCTHTPRRDQHRPPHHRTHVPSVHQTRMHPLRGKPLRARVLLLLLAGAY